MNKKTNNKTFVVRFSEKKPEPPLDIILGGNTTLSFFTESFLCDKYQMKNRKKTQIGDTNMVQNKESYDFTWNNSYLFMGTSVSDTQHLKQLLNNFLVAERYEINFKIVYAIFAKIGVEMALRYSSISHNKLTEKNFSEDNIKKINCYSPICTDTKNIIIGKRKDFNTSTFADGVSNVPTGSSVKPIYCATPFISLLQTLSPITMNSLLLKKGSTTISDKILCCEIEDSVICDYMYQKILNTKKWLIFDSYVAYSYDNFKVNDAISSMEQCFRRFENPYIEIELLERFLSNAHFIQSDSSKIISMLHAIISDNDVSSNISKLHNLYKELEIKLYNYMDLTQGICNAISRICQMECADRIKDLYTINTSHSKKPISVHKDITDIYRILQILFLGKYAEATEPLELERALTHFFKERNDALFDVFYLISLLNDEQLVQSAPEIFEKIFEFMESPSDSTASAVIKQCQDNQQNLIASNLLMLQKVQGFLSKYQIFRFGTTAQSRINQMINSTQSTDLYNLIK